MTIVNNQSRGQRQSIKDLKRAKTELIKKVQRYQAMKGIIPTTYKELEKLSLDKLKDLRVTLKRRKD